MTEKLYIASARLVQPALKQDAAFRSQLESGLGKQHVDRLATAPLDPFVFQLELFLDRFFVLSVDFNQTGLPQYVVISADSLDQEILPQTPQALCSRFCP